MLRTDNVMIRTTAGHPAATSQQEGNDKPFEQPTDLKIIRDLILNNNAGLSEIAQGLSEIRNDVMGEGQPIEERKAEPVGMCRMHELEIAVHAQAILIETIVKHAIALRRIG